MSKDLIVFNNKQYQVAFKSAEISFPEYKDMKAAVDTLHDEYMKWEATPQNLKSSKVTRAKLNKLRKAINDRKNQIARQADKPVQEFKAQIKGLTEEIKETSDHINSQIKVYEDKAKQDRHDQNVKRIKKMAKEAGIEVQPILDQYDPRWDNKSFSFKAFERDVTALIENEKQLETAIKSGSKIISQQAEELKIGPTNYINELKEGTPLDQILDQMKSERKYIDETEKEKEQKKQEEQKSLREKGNKTFDPKTGEIKEKIYTIVLQVTATKKQLNKLADCTKKYGIAVKRLK